MATNFEESSKSSGNDDKFLSDWDPDKFDPVRLSHSIAVAGYNWAEADGAAKLKDSVQGRLKAKIILEYIAGRRADPYASAKIGEVKLKPMSVERAKLLAEQDVEYLDSVTEEINSRIQANTLRVRYDMGRAMMDGLRSKEATHRAMTTLR